MGFFAQRLDRLRSLIEASQRWKQSHTVDFAGVTREIKASPSMARQTWEQVVTEYPEYAELNSLLLMAETTWRRWGISAVDLAQMDDGDMAILRLITNG